MRCIVSGRTALVITDKVIDRVRYNESYTSVIWEDCTLRQWLNGTFYNQAFSFDEKAHIRTSTISNPDNPTYGTRGGNATTDKVFCLSIGEAWQFFSDDDGRTAEPTAHAKNREVFMSDENGCAVWWLRSPGDDRYSAAAVNTDGNVAENGWCVDDTKSGVRPALYINLES